MNRTDRLFALLLHLRGDGWVQANTLARTFGVSVRTIYRDVLALNESGVPVVSVPGQGYQLMEGYFLPPLHFTTQEAVMLMLGANAMRGAFDPEFSQAAELALKKIEAALPTSKQEEVTHLRGHLRIIPPDEGHDTEKLRHLRSAVLARRSVTFQYHKPNTAPENRRVYPLGLVHLYGAWMLGAFDPGKNERRTFRLSRMDHLQVTQETFQRDPTWRIGPGTQERRAVTVRLHFPERLRRAVQERPNFYHADQQDVPGGFQLTLQVRDVRDVFSWVLSWGAGVRVLEPPHLADLLRAEAQAMLKQPDT